MITGNCEHRIVCVFISLSFNIFARLQSEWLERKLAFCSLCHSPMTKPKMIFRSSFCLLSKLQQLCIPTS